VSAEDVREAWEQSTELCVSCPNCAFTFDSTHTDQDGGYSCPLCAEIHLEARLAEIEQDLIAERMLRDYSDVEAHAEREQRESLEARLETRLDEDSVYRVYDEQVARAEAAEARVVELKGALREIIEEFRSGSGGYNDVDPVVVIARTALAAADEAEGEA